MADFKFENLTENVKKHMLSEIEFDIENDKLYISDRLNAEGRRQEYLCRIT